MAFWEKGKTEEQINAVSERVNKVENDVADIIKTNLHIDKQFNIANEQQKKLYEDNIEMKKALISLTNNQKKLEEQLKDVLSAKKDIVNESNSENAAKENGGHESTLTKPEDMERFIAETNVDALAVAIGTSHGVYKGTPKLDLRLMDELNRRSKVPLVMHGGSGTPEKDLVKSIKLGMCKINIFSDILNGYYSGMKEFLNSTENLSIWPSAGNKKALENMKKVILEKYKLFGATDKGRK